MRDIKEVIDGIVGLVPDDWETELHYSDGMTAKQSLVKLMSTLKKRADELPAELHYTLWDTLVTHVRALFGEAHPDWMRKIQDFVVGK